MKNYFLKLSQNLLFQFMQWYLLKTTPLSSSSLCLWFKSLYTLNYSSLVIVSSLSSLARQASKLGVDGSSVFDSNENGGILQSNAYPSSLSILNVPLKVEIESSN